MEVYKSTRTAAEMEYALGAVPNIGPNGNWWIGGQDTGIFAKGINVTGAEVGQTVKIAAVDENGVPTAWEASDFTSGAAYECLFEVEEAVDSVEYNFVDEEGNEVILSEIAVYEHFISTNASGADLNVKLKRLDGTYVNQLVANNYAGTAGSWISGSFYGKIHGKTLLGWSTKTTGVGSYVGSFTRQGGLYPSGPWGDRWVAPEQWTNPIIGISGIYIPGAVGAKSQFYVHGVRV